VTTSALPSSAVPPGDAPRVLVRLYGATDVGHTREHNEDSFLVADLESGGLVAFDHGSELREEGPHGLLFMVADGMGGAAAGELASEMATQLVFDELRSRWTEREALSDESFAEALRDATDVANARIHAHARANPEFRGMGTTATIAGLWRDRVFIAQVGDSRAYLVRDGRLTQLTRDQSLMQRLVDAGEISAEQAETSDRRNIILQALGPEATVRVDLTHQQVRHGDTLILCSDGLSGVVKARDIEAAANDESDPAVLCHALIARANELGGPDNITVVVARFEGNGLDVAIDGDAVGRTVYPLEGTLADDEATPAAGAPVLHKTGEGPRPASVDAAREMLRRNLAPPAPVTPPPVDDDTRRERQQRAFPVMLFLLLLGVALAGVVLYRLFANGD
jgi:protein phosphatase